MTTTKRSNQMDEMKSHYLKLARDLYRGSGTIEQR